MTLPDLEKCTSIAESLERRGLALPALFFLELYRPFSTLFYNVGVASEPLLGAFMGRQKTQRVLECLQSPDWLEQLQQALEAVQRSSTRGAP